MKFKARIVAIFLALTSAWMGADAAPAAALPATSNPILFVTQIPIPADDLPVVTSTFGNHIGTGDRVPRGGDLYIRYPDGTLKNLTALAGFGVAGQQGRGAIAVREPCVHWSGKKAIFSMIVGAAASAGDTKQFVWQLYEVTGLGLTETPVVRRVPRQPLTFNNLSPIYGTDGCIIFTSDRPRKGGAERYLYPQLDEYEEMPTTTGLWSLDPASGNLFMLIHSPSGAFTPILDSFGRVVFTQWDHLQRDGQAAEDEQIRNLFGTFNYSAEARNAVILASRAEFFPEPDTDHDKLLEGTNLNGHRFDHFFPWQINEDGTEAETVNHIGRHELHGSFNSSLNDDPVVRAFAAGHSQRFNPNEIKNFFHIQEDPLNPGTYFGTDTRVFVETHTSGQIVSITAPPTVNPAQAVVRYITHRETESVTSETDTPVATHSGHYRNPLPLSDGSLIAAHAMETRADLNIGDKVNPRSRYDFRLKTLKLAEGIWSADQALTTGIEKTVSYYNRNGLVNYQGPLWELDAREVRARALPARRMAELPAQEQAVMREENINEAALRAYLRKKSLAILVTRDVTSRDHQDRQQPYNLRVSGTAKQTIGGPGKIYDVAFTQFFQADLLRGLGLSKGRTQPEPGRRVLAQPMHDDGGANRPTQGPAGSVRIEADGSIAAFVPARRAMTWQLTDAAGVGVVRERYWLTFQPGEIRSCTSCHMPNDKDQAGFALPENKPEALRELLRYWKARNP